MKYDIVIIGAGAMGSAAAWQLSKRGKSVLMLEQFEVHNNVNASQDQNKAFRIEYAEDLFYSELALKSLDLWTELEKDSGIKCYDPCGCLLLNARENSYALRSYNTLHPKGHPIEVLQPDQLKKRFPQFTENNATFGEVGGILFASKTVDALLSVAIRNGVVLREYTRVINIKADHLIMKDGSTVQFEQLIVTAGAWTAKLLDLPVKPTKQELLYLKPYNPEQFESSVFPVFAEFDWGWYGFPLHSGTVKISKHVPGEELDPDAYREVSYSFIGEGLDFLADCIPALANTQVVGTKVCLYSMTESEDFIIDRLSNRITVAAGFSGHGFKFTPIIGKILADLALDENTELNIERFRSK